MGRRKRKFRRIEQTPNDVREQERVEVMKRTIRAITQNSDPNKNKPSDRDLVSGLN